MDAPEALHPTDQALHAHGLGRLDERSAESVGRHLEACADCRRRVDELTAGDSGEPMREARGRSESPPPVGSSFAGLSGLQSGAGSPAPPPDSLPPGLAENTDYEVIRELGRGGMGVVYLAQNRLMGRKEVLKVISGNLSERSIVRERFLREIRNAAQLHHPNIVTAYSAIRAGDRIVLAMEYVEGYDLARLVKGQGPLSVAHACHFIHQAALGLQHAHERGMVHRDIKPGNMMLTRHGKKPILKILDFGLAKATQEAPIDGGLTREGQMLGTPDYIAPEQSLDAQKADIRADIYSLGCTLYYLLTGGPPFKGSSLYEILQSHHSRDAMPLNQARPEVPAELAAVVARMMAKDPERRFQIPGEVAQALKPFFKSGEAGAVAGPGAVASPAGSQAVAEKSVANPTPTVARPPSAELEVVAIELDEEDDPAREMPGTGAGGGRGLPWLWPSMAGGAVTLCLVLAAWMLAGGAGQKTDNAPPAPAVASHPEDAHPVIAKAPTAAPAPPREAPQSDERPPLAVRKDEPGDGGASPLPASPKPAPATAAPKRVASNRPKPAPAAAVPERVASKPPPATPPKAARVEVKVEKKKPAVNQPRDFRHLPVTEGGFRLSNRNAQPPEGGFWPVLTPDDMTYWQVSDLERLDMNRKGVSLSAGPVGNLLLTKQDDFKKCELSITLSGGKGTEAFLALRAHQGPDGWEAITARVYEHEGRIWAGHQSADFRLPDRGTAIEGVDLGRPMRITFQITDEGAARLVIRKETSSMSYARTPAGEYVGAIGVFVKSGTLVIHHMDARK